MTEFITTYLGGYTILFVLTFLLLVAILCALFVYRQILRLRNNSTRKEINSNVAADLSRRSRELVAKRIDAVFSFRTTHYPTLTDCTLICQHAETPYVYRMIAFDEVLRDIDRQLEHVNSELTRLPGESTYHFLMRVKTVALPELKESFIERIGFLHEWCRFRTQPEFGEAELEELRGMLKEFVKILNNNQASLTSLALKLTKDVPSTRLNLGLSADRCSIRSERFNFQEQIPLLAAQNGNE